MYVITENLVRFSIIVSMTVAFVVILCLAVSIIGARWHK